MKITKFLGICVVLLAGGLLFPSAEAQWTSAGKLLSKLGEWGSKSAWNLRKKASRQTESPGGSGSWSEGLSPEEIHGAASGLRIGGSLLYRHNRGCTDENSTSPECDPNRVERKPIVRTNPPYSGRGLWTPQERLKRRLGNSRSDIQLRPNRLWRSPKAPQK